MKPKQRNMLKLTPTEISELYKDKPSNNFLRCFLVGLGLFLAGFALGVYIVAK